MTALRRHLHPGAWWLWALGLGTATSRTTNPLLLLLLAAVAGYVVAARRTDAPWARAYTWFVRIGLVVFAVRLAIQVLFGGGRAGHVLVELPSVPLPGWAAGVRLGGAVTAEGVVRSAYEGLRLVVLLACVGAANALSSPYRLLRALPGVLYEAGVAATVALAFAPQALVSIGEIREARRLRGRPTRGAAGMRGLAVPVLEGALRRSLDLAASMDSRGFGRAQPLSPARRLTARAATGLGLLLAAAGSYGLLEPRAPDVLGFPFLGAGAVLLAAGLAAGSARSRRTRYRPDRWTAAESLVAASGWLPVAAFVAAGRLGGHALHPFTDPLELPALPLLPLAGTLLALLPAVVAPRPPLPAPRAGRPVAVAA